MPNYTRAKWFGYLINLLEQEVHEHTMMECRQSKSSAPCYRVVLLSWKSWALLSVFECFIVSGTLTAEYT